MGHLSRGQQASDTRRKYHLSLTFGGLQLVEDMLSRAHQLWCNVGVEREVLYLFYNLDTHTRFELEHGVCLKHGMES